MKHKFDKGTVITVIAPPWDENGTFVTCIRNLEKSRFKNPDGSINIDLAMEAAVDIPVGSIGFIVDDEEENENAVVCFPEAHATVHLLKETIKVIKPETPDDMLGVDTDGEKT